MCRGKPFLIAPEIIKGWPNGYFKTFAGDPVTAMKNANSFRAMVYRAGRRAERVRLFDQKTQTWKTRVTVFDKDFKKEPAND